MLLLKGIFISVFIIQLTYGFPDGASTAACMSMVPTHGLITPQVTPAPFSVTPSATNIRPGQTITVTIARTNNSVFLRGFMVLARAGNNTVGQFFLTTGMRIMACATMPSGSVATHSNNNQRNSIILSWTAPTGFTGNVVFHATAVNNFSTFWTGLTSPTVNVTP